MAIENITLLEVYILHEKKPCGTFHYLWLPLIMSSVSSVAIAIQVFRKQLILDTFE
jgi:hypothetical protein